MRLSPNREKRVELMGAWRSDVRDASSTTDGATRVARYKSAHTLLFAGSMLFYAAAFLWVGYLWGSRIDALWLIAVALAAVVAGFVAAIRFSSSAMRAYREELLGAAPPQRPDLQWKDAVWLVPAFAGGLALPHVLRQLPLDFEASRAVMVALAIGAAAFLAMMSGLFHAVEDAVQQEVDSGLHTGARVLEHVPSYFGSLPARTRRTLLGAAGLLAMCSVFALLVASARFAPALRNADPSTENIRAIWQAVTVWLPIGLGGVSLLELGVAGFLAFDSFWNIRDLHRMDSASLAEHLDRGRRGRRTWEELVREYSRPQWLGWAMLGTMAAVVLGLSYIGAPIIGGVFANLRSSNPADAFVARFALAFLPVLGAVLAILALLTITYAYVHSKIRARVLALAEAETRR